MLHVNYIEEPRYKWEIALAGLLHDIGKFYQKSEENQIGKVKVLRESSEHPLIAREFINAHINIFEQAFTDEEIKFITECAVRHHSSNGFSDKILVSKADDKYKRYCEIINISDNISSSERAEIGGNNSKENASMTTPYCRLKLSKEQVDKNVLKALMSYEYTLQKMDSPKAFSSDSIGRQHKSKDMTKFVKSFDYEIDGIKADSKEKLFIELNNLIKSYTWCIPSDCTQKIRDISLYQHLITTSAIATSLYNALVINNKKEENFTINSVKNNKDDLSILHLKLAGAEEYIAKSNSSWTTAIDSIHSKNYSITKLTTEITQDIISSLQLTNANIIVDSAGFDRYILIHKNQLDVVDNILKNINTELLSKYKGELSVDYTEYNLLMISKPGKYGTAMGSILANDKVELNSGLTDVFTINNKWDLSKMIINTEVEQCACKVCGRPSGEEDICSNCKEEQVLVKNNPDTSDFDYFKKQIKETTNRVSVLCVDGDKILDTMRNGFVDEENDYGTISRISTFCNITANFFDKYLRNMIEDDKYIINIDSNKVLIICDSDSSVETACDISQMFNEYTNGKLTLSIAICNTSINQRFNAVIGNCEKELRKVKSLGGNKIIYNKIIYTYEEMQDFIDIKNLMYDSVDNGMEIGTLRKFMEYGRMYRNFVNTKDIQGLMCVPLYEKNKFKIKCIDEQLLKLLTDGFNKVFTEPENVNHSMLALEDIAYDCYTKYKMEENK